MIFAKMKATLFLVVCVALLSECVVGLVRSNRGSDECGKVQRRPKRMIGGKELADNIYPWVVSVEGVKTVLGKQVPFICSGVLVSPRVVLTAAHCESNIGDMAVFYGSHVRSLLKPIGVREKFVTPGFRTFGQTRGMHDLQLLRVREPLSETPICLPREALSAGADVTAAGYGVTSRTSKKPSSRLNELRMKITDRAKCQKEHPKADLTGQLCAISNHGSPFISDSGGPLMYFANSRSYLAGLTSWGKGDTGFNISTVFVDIIRYQSWIREHIENIDPGYLKQGTGPMRPSGLRSSNRA